MLHIAKRIREIFPLCVALVLVIGMFVPSLGTGYFADDFDFAVRLPEAPLLEMITLSTDGTRGGGSWRPLTMVSLWLTMADGQSPTFNHAVSLGLYICLLAILYACVRALFPERNAWFAALVTLLFGLLPIHAEPVIWVAARGDLLAAICALAALLAWLRGRWWLSIGLLIMSLIAKEMWILFGFILIAWSPADLSPRQRLKYSFALTGAVAVWFAVRYSITHYSVGGYSITGSHVLGVQHLSNEAIGFFVGSWSFGEFQSWIVRFAQYYWFIIIWPLAAAACTLTYQCAKNKRVRFLSASLAVLLLPILLLGVPFVRPEASLAEQRYWFAPSIFLILLLAHSIASLTSKFRSALLIIFCAVSAIGMHANIKIYQGAGFYRDSVLTAWKMSIGTQAPNTQVALLPDSWYGVHLLASPFFERALEYEKLPQPHSVAPWYQWCTAWCMSPVTVQQKSPQTAHIFAQDPRIFSSKSAGLRHDITQQIENGTSLAIWSGVSWLQFSEIGVENRRP